MIGSHIGPDSHQDTHLRPLPGITPPSALSLALLLGLAPSGVRAMQAAPLHNAELIGANLALDNTRYILVATELVPIPSIWGHVAGGGGDEGVKPFINARIAAFLRDPARR